MPACASRCGDGERIARVLTVAATLLAALASASAVRAERDSGALPAGAGGPLVEQLVAFRSGRVERGAVRASAATVRVGARRCAVPAGTALAALARSRPARLRLRDFGSCSRRARDAAGLFVSGIGPDRNRGDDGWVYKVGNRLATAGSADPSGPFGSGRLRKGARVAWFYCRFEERARSCQRTLALQVRLEGAAVAVQALSYDDRGQATPAPGATVVAAPGGASAVTGLDGRASLALGASRYAITAEAPGLVPSFAEEVAVP